MRAAAARHVPRHLLIRRGHPPQAVEHVQRTGRGEKVDEREPAPPEPVEHLHDRLTDGVSLGTPEPRLTRRA